MKKEVAEKVFKDRGFLYIPQWKKIGISISKFERYPEMAAEGVGRAILYLLLLAFICSIIISACLTYKFNGLLKEEVKILNENISVINYKDGILQVEFADGRKELEANGQKLIVDTDEISNEKIAEYEEKVSKNRLGIIWLKDYVIIKNANNKEIYEYKKTLDAFGIQEFNKIEIINFLNNEAKSVKIFIVIFLILTLLMLISSMISMLIDALVLSVFGVLTSMIAKIKMRYKAVFNMSIYAITLPVVLQLIYRVVILFTDFEIKYFDLMYSAIAYICLAAAIFMIKSDVVKQQIELIKMQEQKKESNTEIDQNKEEEKNNEENREDENKEKENKDEKNEEDKEIGNSSEEQGSNA